MLGNSTGGIARHVAQVTDRLDGSGFVVDIAGPATLPLRMPKPLHDVSIPNGPVRGHLAAIRRLRAIIGSNGYDVVHAHGLRAGIDAALAARRGTRLPVLLTVHNVVHPDVAGPARALLYKPAESLAVRLTDHTFAVSREIAKRLEGVRGGRGKVEVLYLGIGDPPAPTRDRAAIRRELGAEGSLVVTASRLAPQKALHVMFDALARLDLPVTFAVLGTGPLEGDLKDAAERAGVGGRVRWLGFRADVADYIAAADVFCLSSVWEGVPLAAQEAVLLGVPVVATSVGGMPELVDDAVTGRLVPPEDPAALASALRQVLSNDVLRTTFAAAARARLAERFSTEKMIARLAAEYRERAR